MASTAPTSPADSASSFKGLGLVVALLTGCLVGAMVGFGIAALAGWLEAGSLAAALLATASWVAPALFIAFLLMLIASRDTGKLAPAVLFLSFLRMLGAIATGGLIAFLVKPEAKTFWIVFLAAGLCCLAAETLWTIRTLNRVGATAAVAQSSTLQADHAGAPQADRGPRTGGIGA